MPKDAHIKKVAASYHPCYAHMDKYSLPLVVVVNFVGVFVHNSAP